MSRQRLILICLIVMSASTVFMTWDSSALAKKKDKPQLPLTFVPDENEELPLRFVDDQILFSTPAVSIRVRHLDAQGRLEFFKRRGGLDRDPFASPDGTPDSFQVFQLTIVNRSSLTITMNPKRAILRTNKKDYLLPLDLTTIAMASSSLPDSADLMTPLSQCLYDSEVEVGAEEHLDRLLIYRGLHSSTKSALLEISYLFIGADTLNLMFPFKAREPAGRAPTAPPPPDFP